METGTYISGLGHVAVVGWAILGGAMSSDSQPPEFQVTDISVVSEAAFAALISDAPLIATNINQPSSPDVSEAAPDAPKAGELPQLSSFAQPEAPQAAGTSPDLASVKDSPRASAQTDAPQLAEQPTTDVQGATLIVPTAPLANRDRNGLKQPDQLAMIAPEPPAPRVDVTPAPKPPTDAEKAQEAEKATTPDPEASKPAEKADEKAPDQAATEIITEAKEQEKTAAPVRSSRPKGRPAKLAENSSAATGIEQAIAKDQAQTGNGAGATTPVRASVPSGPPLSQNEREGLRLAVRDCWNVNPTSDAARITVTIAVTMDRSGKPSGPVQFLSATEGSQAAKDSAFEAARRAVLRCGRTGFDLPAEKYDQWRDIEMTFNPEKMRRK